MNDNNDHAARLEELRRELRAERISYAELAELQGLAAYIDPGDVELLEAAGVPEHGQDIWQMLENPPERHKDIADLYHWSLNYDAGKGPFSLFLDLIGWSADQLGENIYAIGDASGLGYVELSKLADALKVYADDPQGSMEYVEALMAAESAE